MNKVLVSVFFLTVFAFLIAAPTIIVAIDKTADITYFYSITEEEEHNSIKKITRLETLNSESIMDLESLFFSNKSSDLHYAFKRYTKPYLHSISQPPEFIL
ncbi:MAG: hypothetical protein KDD05_09705 [Psychroserpens sp.]|nr:hypothetical protein [Psychroserpens sp.]